MDLICFLLIGVLFCLYSERLEVRVKAGRL